MTSKKQLKQRIRERMAATGERLREAYHLECAAVRQLPAAVALF